MKAAASFLCFLFSLQLTAQINNNIIDSVTTVTADTAVKHSTVVRNILAGAGYTGVTFLCYRYADENVRHFAQANQNKSLTAVAKTIEQAGLGSSSILITAATGITAVITKNKKLQQTAILLAGGHIINDLVTNQVKITFQRHRPNTGNPYNSFDWRGGQKVNTSFISAHTSNAFATAAAFAISFKDTKWVPVAAYSAASLVGVCRIYNNAHWASDVLGGAAVGFLSVQAVNGIYHLASKKWMFLPQVNNGHYGATVIYCLQ